ncbi:MAG: PIN domain-containing protein [Tannerella sp.]|jgi:predicted nucleic acid-binding protein|nr:PIN domain-containing protein [Tannerella sp.]
MQPMITMNEESFALDTNILIYMESDDLHKRSIAETLLSFNPVISSQVISEFINVTRRLRNISKRQIILEAADLFRYCPIVPTDRAALDLAAFLIQRHDFQIFDAIIIASALEADCEILYSEDMHHGLIVENRLRILNPFIQ